MRKTAHTSGASTWRVTLASASPLPSPAAPPNSGTETDRTWPPCPMREADPSATEPEELGDTLLAWRSGGAAGSLLPDVAPGSCGPSACGLLPHPVPWTTQEHPVDPGSLGCHPETPMDMGHSTHAASSEDPSCGHTVPPAKCGCFRGPFSFGRNTSVSLSLQAGEKHYHPLCALCVRCGRMFAEGEEMYLQGKDKTALPHPLGQDRNMPWARAPCWVGTGGWPVSPL